MAGQHVQPVDLRPPVRWPARRAGLVARLGHFARGAGVVGTDQALDAMAFQEGRALRQDHHMAMRLASPAASLAPGTPRRLTCTRTKASSTICSPALGNRLMHVGHPAIGRVFDRQHAQIDLARAGHLDHVLEGLAGNQPENRGAPAGRPDANRRPVPPERRCVRPCSCGSLVRSRPRKMGDWSRSYTLKR